MPAVPAPPGPTPDRTLGTLVAALAGLEVLSLLMVQLAAAMNLPYDHPGQVAFDLTITVARYGLLGWLALRVPQPTVRVLAVTVFAIFLVNAVLGQLGIFSLYAPWTDPVEPPAFEYFQF